LSSKPLREINLTNVIQLAANLFTIFRIGLILGLLFKGGANRQPLSFLNQVVSAPDIPVEYFAILGKIFRI
jgi:hypothetical protein